MNNWLKLLFAFGVLCFYIKWSSTLRDRLTTITTTTRIFTSCSTLIIQIVAAAAGRRRRRRRWVRYERASFSCSCWCWCYRIWARLKAEDVAANGGKFPSLILIHLRLITFFRQQTNKHTNIISFPLSLLCCCCCCCCCCQLIKQFQFSLFAVALCTSCCCCCQ